MLLSQERNTFQGVSIATILFKIQTFWHQLLKPQLCCFLLLGLRWYNLLDVSCSHKISTLRLPLITFKSWGVPRRTLYFCLTWYAVSAGTVCECFYCYMTKEGWKNRYKLCHVPLSYWPCQNGWFFENKCRFIKGLLVLF